MPSSTVFIKEMAKNKAKLNLAGEAEWEEYFNIESIKVLHIIDNIKATDKAIDELVYQLYRLTPQEIEIVKNS